MSPNNQQVSSEKSMKDIIYLGKKNIPFIEGILRRLTKSIAYGRIIFKLDNGQVIDCDSGSKGPTAEINIHSLILLKRIISGGYLGLAEGYIFQDWTTPSLANVFDFGAANMDALDQNLTSNFLIQLSGTLTRFFQQNNKRGSRKNIAAHYDLGNDFFSEWLDPTMTYSSALFTNKKEKLHEAQQKKYQRIINVLDIKENHKVLEIGCGWGGFAEYAGLNTGAQISGITISREQHKFAVNRIANAGLNGQVEILLKDYREVIGNYDKIVSIEMLEAVGESYWPIYFKTLSDRLKNNGAAMVQVITVPDNYFEFYRKTMDFIQRYIFPGGMLLCPEKISEHSMSQGLKVADTYFFGPSYAQTIELWQKKFQLKWHEIEQLGFDEKFKRIWEYYLDYTSAGFRSGAINVGQFHLRKI